jgi:para-aminobenzoate synthetase component 2
VSDVRPRRILVVDNYDSFVFNLVQYLGQLGAVCTVRRNDQVAPADALGYDGVLLSPGPGTPEKAGVCVELVREVEGQVPVLGVCLGHQAIAVAHGAVVERAPELLHGKTSEVEHEGAGVLAGLPSPFTATRYHSLAAVRESIPEVLEITAETGTGVVMGLQHRTAPLCGVQFHPESVLTEGGYQMLGNWLESLGMAGAAQRAAGLSPLIKH